MEGLGGKDVGYHPIQSAVAATGGTQCGYCSPGMVMQLHAYLQVNTHHCFTSSLILYQPQEHPSATREEIDNILDGNICRCTGKYHIIHNRNYYDDACVQDTDPFLMLSSSLPVMLRARLII